MRKGQLTDYAVREYILGAIDLSSHGETAQSVEELIIKAYEIFLEEKPDAKGNFRDETWHLMSWLQGVPSTMHVEHVSTKQEELMKGWGITLNKYDEPWVVFYTVIAVELVSMYHKIRIKEEV